MPIYSAPAMEWEHMRAHYVRLLRAAKRDREVTQKQVAAAGGLKGQNYISKIKTASRLGPAVEIFIRAIEGLGLPPSAFFAELEGQPPPVRAPQDASPIAHDLAVGIDRPAVIHAIIDTLQRGLQVGDRPRRRRRRSRRKKR